MTREPVDILVVGGGPAGLAAAARLRALGAGRVLVVERDREAGGVPRHSTHAGFGLRDLHRLLTGPGYARRLVEMADRAGAEIRAETPVVGWAGDRVARMTGPAGPREVAATAVVLATGCRERPRSARLVPGSRPAGVFTTGALQRAVDLHGHPVGRRAVVVGAEHVAFSAVLTLERAGVRTAAVVTDLPRHQTYPALALMTTTRLRVPIVAGARVTGILGRDRVTGVEATDLATGARRVVACDTVVFTGDWIPEHEVARLAGVAIDPGTRGPRVDTALRTSVTGVFAAGNLIHGAETSDVATLEGRHVADAVADWLARGAPPFESALEVRVESPVGWAAPNAIGPAAARSRPPGRHLTVHVTTFVDRPILDVSQGGRSLWRGRPRAGVAALLPPRLSATVPLGALVPGRSLGIPADWIDAVDPEGGPVVVSAPGWRPRGA